WDPRRRAFIQHVGATTLDAAALLMPLVRFVSPTERVPLPHGGSAQGAVLLREDARVRQSPGVVRRGARAPGAASPRGRASHRSLPASGARLSASTCADAVLERLAVHVCRVTEPVCLASKFCDEGTLGSCDTPRPLPSGWQLPGR